MRYLGFRHDGERCIGVVGDDGASVTRLATIEEFYDDLDTWSAAEATGPAVARADIEQATGCCPNETATGDTNDAHIE